MVSLCIVTAMLRFHCYNINIITTAYLSQLLGQDIVSSPPLFLLLLNSLLCQQNVGNPVCSLAMSITPKAGRQSKFRCCQSPFGTGHFSCFLGGSLENMICLIDMTQYMFFQQPLLYMNIYKQTSDTSAKYISSILYKTP